MTQDSYAIGTAVLQQRSLYLLLTKEDKQVRREALALLERPALALSDKCFLFLYALEKMLGALDSPEVNRYFDGLELIGYPMEFIEKVSTGNSYPIAELSEYLDSHKYEIYQLRQEVQILKSIDSTLNQLLGLCSFKPNLQNLFPTLQNLFPAPPVSHSDLNWMQHQAGEEARDWTEEQKKDGMNSMELGGLSEDQKGSISSSQVSLADRLKAKLNENS